MIITAEKVAGFIHENNLENSRIMAQWNIAKDDASDLGNIAQQSSPAINAYFDRNIFYNFNNGDECLTYNTHIIPTEADIKQAYALWRSYGPPDVLIGEPALHAVFSDNVSYAMYTQVADFPIEMFFKRFSYSSLSFNVSTKIYVRNDLLDQYGLNPYKDS
ncbi:MAG: hypothetical protein R2881_03535 [Eubacteriales bacterium]